MFKLLIHNIVDTLKSVCDLFIKHNRTPAHKDWPTKSPDINQSQRKTVELFEITAETPEYGA